MPCSAAPDASAQEQSEQQTSRPRNNNDGGGSEGDPQFTLEQLAQLHRQRSLAEAVPPSAEELRQRSWMIQRSMNLILSSAREGGSDPTLTTGRDNRVPSRSASSHSRRHTWTNSRELLDQRRDELLQILDDAAQLSGLDLTASASQEQQPREDPGEENPDSGPTE